jgi:hypothetical protein
MWRCDALNIDSDESDTCSPLVRARARCMELGDAIIRLASTGRDEIAGDFRPHFFGRREM